MLSSGFSKSMQTRLRSYVSGPSIMGKLGLPQSKATLWDAKLSMDVYPRSKSKEVRELDLQFCSMTCCGLLRDARKCRVVVSGTGAASSDSATVSKTA